MNKRKLIREQLDSTLKQFGPLCKASVPGKGWVRAVRDAFGMTARQLASRLGVAQQAVARIENDELAGAVTIKTMRRVAECLDCEFVYALVPHTSLADTYRKRIEHVAKRRLARASQTMALEDQALKSEEDEEVLDDMVTQMADDPPRDLWDD